MNIILEGAPRSTQTCYKYTCTYGHLRSYMADVCTVLKEDYQWQVRQQYKGPVLTGPVKIGMTIFFGTKRAADIDNFNKLAFDALTGLVYEDDSQIEALCISKDYDKERPRIELRIREAT